MDLANNCGLPGGEHSSAVLDEITCAPTGLVPNYSALFFGSLIINRDEDVANQSVTLRNVGKKDIGITKVGVVKGKPNFGLAGNTVFPKVVRPGESFTITVKVSFGTIGQLFGTLEIDTNEDRLPYVIGLGGRVVGANTGGGDGGEGGGGGYDDTVLKDYIQKELTAVRGDFSASITDERWARADAISAEAGYRLTLAATLRNETEARVMVEYIARVTAFEAEATARLVLEANVKGYTDASLVEERRVYASRFEAIASDRITLEANMRDNVTAKITAERTAWTTALQAEATARLVLEAYFNGEFVKTNAYISQVDRTLTDANGALAERVSYIEATYTSGGEGGGEGVDTVARGQIQEERTVRANKDEALTTMITNAQSEYRNNNTTAIARIAAEEATRASAIEAAASRSTQIEANFGQSGNLLSNSSFETLDGWGLEYGTGAVEQNGAGDNWRLGYAENNLTIHDVVPEADRAVFTGVTSAAFGVEPLSYIQFYTYVASHRARGWCTIFFYDTNGVGVGYGGENSASRIDHGGPNIAEHDRVGLKSIQVPASAVSARLGLRSYPTEGQADPYAWFHRPMVAVVDKNMKLWVPYAPGNSRVVTNKTRSLFNEEITARSTADQAQVARTVVLEAQLTGTAGSVLSSRIDETQRIAANANGATATRAEEIYAAFVGANDARYGEIVAANALIASEAAASVGRDEAQARRSDVLESRSNGAGNLLPNTEFNTTEGWGFTTGNLSGVNFGVNIAGDLYHLVSENGLSMHQNNNAGLGFNGQCEWYSSQFSVEEGTFIQAYVYANAHRANTMLYISWFNSDGIIFLNSTTPPQPGKEGHGVVLSGYDQIGHKAYPVPASAVSARIVLRKFDTVVGQADSYAWFTRPYVGLARGGQTEWNPYSPGTNKPGLIGAKARIEDVSTTLTNANGATASRAEAIDAAWRVANDVRYNEIIAANARITNEATAAANATAAVATRAEQISAYFAGQDNARYGETVANNARIAAEEATRANQDGALASRIDSVVAEAGSIRASLIVAQGAVADLSGRSQVYWSVTSDLGGGRGGIELRHASGAYAQFDITANVRIFGSLVVDGTINTEKVAQNAITNFVSGGFGNLDLDSENPGSQVKQTGDLVIVSTGGKVRIDLSCDIVIVGGATGPTLTITLYRRNPDGSTVALRQAAYPSNMTGQPLVLWSDDVVPVGNVGYFVTASKTGSISNGRYYSIRAIRMFAQEFKR